MEVIRGDESLDGLVDGDLSQNGRFHTVSSINSYGQLLIMFSEITDTS